jgi:membrane protease YdiL (CAAX protease family)
MTAIGADIGLGDALGYLTLGVLLFTLTEELTWRGFILPRLQAGISALTANLLLGLAWALWHTPAFLIVDEQQDSYPYVGFLLLTMSAAALVVAVEGPNSLAGSCPPSRYPARQTVHS